MRWNISGTSNGAGAARHRHMGAALMTLAVLGQGSGCSSGDQGNLGFASCSGPSLSTGDSTFTVKVGGQDRVYDVHVPATYKGSAVPVVVFWHPLTQTKDYGKATMVPLSDREGFIAVFPQGIGNSWNGGACCGPANSTASPVDDVGFARALLKDLESRTCVDTSRIYATGFSNGGFMSHRLACEASDLFAAIAPDAGVLGIPQDQCHPIRPVPVLQIHGTADPLVPYNGGSPPAGGLGLTNGAFVSVADTVSGWATRDGCTGQPVQTLQKGMVTCQTYEQCRAGAQVELCTVQNGGHCWFGEPVCFLGTNTQDLSAAEASWAFFKQFRL